MGIAGMVVWVLTAGIGIYLLAAGIAGQRATAGASARPAVAGGPDAEGSPLLEFVHPALALLGLTFWIFFVMTGYRAFAWVAFGVAAATVTAGLSWELAARRRGGGRGGPRFPRHLITLHGLAAACTVTLVVIAAITAGHG